MCDDKTKPFVAGNLNRPLTGAVTCELVQVRCRNFAQILKGCTGQHFLVSLFDLFGALYSVSFDQFLWVRYGCFEALVFKRNIHQLV